tara:strand:+ start:869 stop:1162 length:294 start_codon:yes stop_codon:yes gene_type:complete
MKDKYWQDLANKHLVGRTIVKAEWLSPSESQELMGWDYQPLELFLDNGTILTPMADDEGNNAGAILTNVKVPYKTKKGEQKMGEVIYPVFRGKEDFE